MPKVCKIDKCNYFVFSNEYCKNHQYFNKKKKKYIYKRKKTNELATFKEIWDERPHVCQVTGISIPQFDIRCFSHILSKGAYPSFRLDKKNIWIVLPHIHNHWEFKDRNHPMFDEKRKVMQDLKREYYSNNSR